MNIERALSDIEEIRVRLNRTEAFVGFRSVAVGFSVLAVLGGSWAEMILVTHPQQDIGRFLIIWLAVAVASAIFALTEMGIRGRASGNRLVWRMHRSLVCQLMPSLLVGAALTALIFLNAKNQLVPEASLGWALPGVWAMMYGLGLFQCSRNLPRSTQWVAAYFLVSGLSVLVGTRLGWSIDHLQMMATFGAGQLLLSGVLFWNLERTRDQK